MVKVPVAPGGKLRIMGPGVLGIAGALTATKNPLRGAGLGCLGGGSVVPAGVGVSRRVSGDTVQGDAMEISRP